MSFDVFDIFDIIGGFVMARPLNASRAFALGAIGVLSALSLSCVDNTSNPAQTSILDQEFSRFVVSPFSVYFPSGNWDEDQIQIIDIRNIGTITGVISDIRLEPEGAPFSLLAGHHYLSAESYFDPDDDDEPGLAARGTFNIYLDFHPTIESRPLIKEETHSFEAELVFNTDDPFEPELRVPIIGPVRRN